MGCDIHSFVERKEQETGNWIVVDGPNPYYPKYDKKKIVTEGWVYSSRHYLFFAFLADVRNYGNIKPLADTKGLPDDVSDTVREYLDDDCDIHSTSYFTLKELEEADLSQTMSITRMVTNEAAEAYRKHGTIPTSWCGGTNQPNYETLTWNAPLKDEIEESLKGIIEKLQGVATEYNLDKTDIRFVFGFDN